jgi:hypothetical protein
MGGRSEPETAKAPLRDMPMRQGEIGGSRPADFDCLLLLRELSRSRKPLRTPGFRATRAQSRRWNRLRPISKGSSACVTGQEYLEEYRLKPDSPTRRVIATCCNSAMFLDFTKGHWLTMYRNRFPTGAPPLEMRVMTHDRRDGVELADDLPNYDGHSGKFMLRLIAAWIAMGLRRPEITLGKSARKSQ